MAQWIKVLTSTHEDVDSIPGLSQWVRIQYCHKLCHRLQMRLGSGVAVLWLQLAARALIRSLAWELPYAAGVALKRQNKQTKTKKQQKQTSKKQKLPMMIEIGKFFL